ncbi:hypothetical protein I4I73_05550 [Pseudonocardia sp. KRD-184]|uniref:Uncharacterized protein n=1 Tax=Pseudonocardia oceani TaxID=2792013 RepID=A0ABS6UJS3_9PSEU|nr:DUF6365 family protein [Pseudonocardia oceani]MBW0088617.1 hypothetical protein [Pseudonocardia oceani]MBW0095460.1 hypothetical protein [Pseudonocardia oceani]MBW0109057.1 hypothetical protein [Pseudonocardia oceani]MBW0120018.1 hypothetical protein [Pseudonocardia oceani]MBW0132474.1 hypothetical protein [Pseudonocardia oceani]
MHLFLALGRSGWGETILGVELARDLVRLGEAVRFVAHVSMAPVLAGGPWDCEFVGDGPGPRLSTRLSAHIARHRAQSVVLVDFAVATRSLERLGVDPADLLSYGVPVIALDSWNSRVTGREMDVYGRRTDVMSPLIDDLRHLLVPSPLSAPVAAPGVYGALPPPLSPAAHLRDATRQRLGLTRGDKVVLVCTATWQEPGYLATDPVRRGVSLAGRELICLYTRMLGADVHLVHVGPTRFEASGLLGDNYHRLPPMPPHEFAELVPGVDLLVSLNISATTVAQAVANGVPALVLGCDGASGERARARLGPDPLLLDWAARHLPLYPFDLWPLGLRRFLAPLLDRNPYKDVVNQTDVLDADRFHAVASALLRDGDARHRYRQDAHDYTGAVRDLPSGGEVLLSFLH